MTERTPTGSRFPRDGWFLASTPGGSGKFIGAIIALCLVLPFIAGTFLERGLGEVPALVLLGGVAIASLAGGILLVVRRFRVLAAFLGSLAVGAGLATWITATMNW